jgi:hypothetical protein
MLRSMSGDMKFVGIVTIIGGAISCLSIIGAVIGVPVIFGGIRLKDSAATFASYAGSADASHLRSALELQGRYFRIQKILMIVGIALAGLYILLAFFVIGFAFMGS